MATGFTQVSGSKLTDSTGALISNATIVFTPCNAGGVPLSFQVGGGGQATDAPVSAPVAGGAFSVQLADTSLTQPANICYKVAIYGRSYLTGQPRPELLGPGYLIQPTGATWDFDTFIPNVPALATIQTGPQGPVGPPASFLGEYQNGVTYEYGQAVNYTDGSTYVCVLNGTLGIPPTVGGSNANWSLLALSGAVSSTVNTRFTALDGATVTGGALIDSLTVTSVSYAIGDADVATPTAAIPTFATVLVADGGGNVALAIKPSGTLGIYGGAAISNGATIAGGATVTGGATIDSVTAGSVAYSSTELDIATPTAALPTYASVLVADSNGNVGVAILPAGTLGIFGGAAISNGATVAGGLTTDALVSASSTTTGKQTVGLLQVGAGVISIPDGAGVGAYLDPVVDANGNLCYSPDASGNFHVGGQLVIHNGVVTPTGASFVPLAPIPAENLIPSSSAMSNLTAATLNVFIGLGQSLSNGYLSVPPLTTQQNYNNLMLTAGIREGTNGAAVQASQIASLVPLVEATSPLVDGSYGEYDGETIIGGATDQVSLQCMKRGVKVPNAGAVVAYSGQAYSVMEKGTTTYNSLLSCASAFSSLKSGSICRGLFLMHGETDEDNNNASYGANLIAWQANLNQDINTQMGTNKVIPMYISQIQSYGLYGHTAPVIDPQMLTVVEQNPTLFRMVGPKYFLPYVDSPYTDDGNGLHLTNVGERIMGEYYGKAAMWDLLAPDTAPWTGLRPLSWTLVGRTILIDFYVPVAPLVLDTSLVSQPTIPGTMYGFEFTDGTNTSPAIAGVSIAGPTSVKLTLAANPTTSGTMYVSYAYTAVAGQGAGPLMGPRGNLRDSDTTPAIYDGRALYNWCVTFRKQVTV